MRPQIVSVSSVAASSSVPLDINNCTATVAYQVVITGTSATFDVQASLDGTNWFDIEADKTANLLSHLDYVPKYMRLNVSIISSATVTLTIIQNG